MPLEVVHAGERNPQDVAQRLGHGDAHQERTHQSRSARNRHTVQIRQRHPRLLQRQIHHHVDVLHMVARRQLGHDAAVFLMHLRLR